MATIPEVKIKISGDPRGVDAAIKSVQGSLRRLGSDLSGIQALAARALSFSGLGATASVAGILALAKSTADVADQMGKAAQGAGVAVEQFSRLAFAGNLAAVSQEDLGAALRRLSADAADGGKLLQELGLSATDAAGKTKSADQIFAEVADLFQSLPEGVTRTNAAVTLFGRNLAGTLLPLLSGGSAGLKALADESDRFGKTITGDQFRRAEEFNDNLTRLQALAQGAGQEIGNALIPALNDLALAFLESFTEGEKLSRDQSIREWADGAARAVAFVVDAFDGVGRAVRITGRIIGAQAAALGRVLQGDLQGSARIQRELLADIDSILNEKLFSDRLDNIQSAEVRSGQARVDNERKVAQQKEGIAKELFQAQLRLDQLRKKSAEEAATEELKGAERLRDALRTAWQASVDGARTARDEAKKLLEQAAGARQSGIDRAAERRSRSLSPEEQSRQAAFRAEELRSQANLAAQGAIVATYEGQVEKAQRLAAEATKLAERAEQFTDRIADDDQAATLFEQLGQIREDALKAQARVKELEAKNLEEVAAAQNEQIAKAEARIEKLKAELEKPVQIKSDIAQAEAEIKRLQGELDKITDKTVTVTVNTVSAGVAPEAAPGFARGGFTGPGGKYQPAGIVHAGEFVLRQEVVRQAGMRRMLERLNRYGADALQGFADGGFVGGGSSTPVHLHWPDGTESKVSVRKAEADALLRDFRRASLKAGGRR